MPASVGITPSPSRCTHPGLPCSGADASVRNEDGQTAGDLAEEQGNEELADMLHRRTALKRLQTFTSSSRGRAGGAGGDAEGARI